MSEIENWINTNEKLIFNLWSIYTEHNIVDTDEDCLTGVCELTLKLNPPFEDMEEFVYILWVYIILQKLMHLNIVEKTLDSKCKIRKTIE